MGRRGSKEAPCEDLSLGCQGSWPGVCTRMVGLETMLSSLFGAQEPLNVAWGSSVPWSPIYRVLQTTGEPSSRKLVSHLANTTPPGGKMQLLRFQLDNFIGLEAIFPKAGVSPWGAVVKM